MRAWGGRAVLIVNVSINDILLHVKGFDIENKISMLLRVQARKPKPNKHAFNHTRPGSKTNKHAFKFCDHSINLT